MLKELSNRFFFIEKLFITSPDYILLLFGGLQDHLARMMVLLGKIPRKVSTLYSFCGL